MAQLNKSSGLQLSSNPTWNPPQAIDPTNGFTNHKPALAVLGDTIYCLYLSSNDGNVWLTSTTLAQSSWTPSVQLSEDTGSAVAKVGLGVFQNTLHAILTLSNDQLLHYKYDTAKSAWKQMGFTGATASSAVSMVEYQGYLYCVYTQSLDTGVVDLHTGIIYYQTWNPTEGWTDPKTLNQASAYEPAAYVTQNTLYILLAPGDGEVMNWLIYDNSTAHATWSAANPLNQSSKAGVSVASDSTGDWGSTSGNAWAAYMPPSSDYVWITGYSGAFGAWSYDGFQTTIQASKTPALVYINNDLVMVYTPLGSSQLYWTQTDNVIP